MQIVDVGGIIGYRALFSNEPSINSAIAMEDVETCYIPKEALMSLIQKSPELALKLLEKLAHEYNQMTQRFQHGINHSATERVAEALLFLRDNFKDRTWTRKEIAEWAGTTPETAMRTLSDFEEKGLIKQQGRQIHIENRKKLLEVAKIHI
jgi:CRP-like cAMP-binding protein